MTRKAKGAPFQMRSGNATPFKNMASSYAQPASSPIQEGDSPLQQANPALWIAAKIAKNTPRVTKYVKGLYNKTFTKSDDVAKLVKKQKDKATKTKDLTKRDYDIKVENQAFDGRNAKQTIANKAYAEGVKSVPTVAAVTPSKYPKLKTAYNITKGLVTGTGAVYIGDQIYQSAKGSGNTSVEDIGGYLDKPKNTYIKSADGDSTDYSPYIVDDY
jgi:hypothetical protein